MSLSGSQQVHLKTLLQSGIPLNQHPYQVLAREIEADERDVMAAVKKWVDDGLIKRMGLVVKHRALGYRANAMVVWNIPDHDLERVGGLLAAFPSVTLCYQRPRKLPLWPYNLFCMIHGRTRDGVLAQLDNLVEQHQLQSVPKDVLFSYREFKQCGARYFSHRLLAKPAVEKPSIASESKNSDKGSDKHSLTIPVKNIDKVLIGQPAGSEIVGQLGQVASR